MCVVGVGLGEGAADVEDACLTVAFEVDAGDQAVAEEEGEDVVAVDALGRRDVDLYPVVEVEEALGAVALPNEGVERGEEGTRLRGAAQAVRAFGRSGER